LDTLVKSAGGTAETLLESRLEAFCDLWPGLRFKITVSEGSLCPVPSIHAFPAISGPDLAYNGLQVGIA